MIKIAVAEDETVFLHYIEKYTHQFYQKKHILTEIDVYENSELLYFQLDEQKKYDLYILDIDMPKVNGLQLAKKIREYDRDAYIIFITSHLKYSIVGYEFNVFRYIPKFHVEEKLNPALESVTQEILLTSEGNYVISTNSRYEKIPYQSIYYIHKDGKNSVLVCESQTCKVRKSLKQVHEELNPEQFIFIERGYIVNIVKVSKAAGNDIHLLNGEILRVGGSYLKEVKERIANFWSRHI